MTTNRPEAAVWLDIPGNCPISGEFTGDDDLHIVFGGLKDGVEVLFERPALERFVQLATELLALPIDGKERPAKDARPSRVTTERSTGGQASAAGGRAAVGPTTVRAVGDRAPGAPAR
jgi:hypothetical protein